MFTAGQRTFMPLVAPNSAQPRGADVRRVTVRAVAVGQSAEATVWPRTELSLGPDDCCAESPMRAGEVPVQGHFEIDLISRLSEFQQFLVIRE